MLLRSAPLHLHSSPVYQITNLINLTLHQPHSLHLSSIYLFLWCFISATEAFPLSCRQAVTHPCVSWAVSLDIHLWKCLGALLTHVGGVGMADVVQIGAMWTEPLQMAKVWCQLFYWFKKNPPTAIKWWLSLKTPVVNKIRLHVSFCMFVLLHTARNVLPPGGTRGHCSHLYRKVEQQLASQKNIFIFFVSWIQFDEVSCLYLCQNSKLTTYSLTQTVS